MTPTAQIWESGADLESYRVALLRHARGGSGGGLCASPRPARNAPGALPEAVAEQVLTGITAEWAMADPTLPGLGSRVPGWPA